MGDKTVQSEQGSEPARKGDGTQNHRGLNLNIPPPDQTLIIYPAKTLPQAVDQYRLMVRIDKEGEKILSWVTNERETRNMSDEMEGVRFTLETMRDQTNTKIYDAPRITYLPNEP